MESLLTISDLHIAVDGKEIVRGLNLTIHEGEIHAIMGPNGSGKSTLVNTLMGHPKYQVTSGSAIFRDEDILAKAPDERAKMGLFLAFQYPKEIAGVSLRNFLFAAFEAQMSTREANHKKMSPIKFKAMLEEKMRILKIDPTFADRFVNQGFSGGEKKKAEILQMHVLKPVLALLDETDSGLDVDALKIVAEGVNSFRTGSSQEKNKPSEGVGLAGSTPKDTSKGRMAHGGKPTRLPSVLIVTHYARILEHLKPDRVHVMIRGKIVESGGADLAHRLEKEGYGSYGMHESDQATKLTLES